MADVKPETVPEIPEEKAHSRWSASSSSRYFKCHGSFVLGELHKAENVENEAAAYGSACHTLAERCLLKQRDPEHFINSEIRTKKFQFVVDEEMAEIVTTYYDYVRDRAKFFDGHQDFNQDGSKSFVWIEKKLKLDPINPIYESGGTIDCLIYDAQDQMLEIIDLKAGRGFVDAINNAQLRTYALAFLVNYPNILVRSVKTTIVQPRHPKNGMMHRSEIIETPDLLTWRDKLAETMAFCKRAECDYATIPRSIWVTKYLNTGDQCTFCPAKLHCPALEKQIFDCFEITDDANGVYKVNRDFNVMTPQDISSFLDLTDVIETWVKAVKAKAIWMAEQGTPIPDYVLENIPPREKWLDEECQDVVIGICRNLKIDKDKLFTKPKLRTPKQIKAELRKEGFTETLQVLEDYSTFVSSGKRLVKSKDVPNPPPQTVVEKFFRKVPQS